ncbi:MAG: deoxyhypusine synthase family protein [Thermoplasmatota archaeon]
MPKSSRKEFLHTPVEQFEAGQVDSVADLVDAMKNMSFQARALGSCMTVWENMLQDPDRPTVVLGLAGSAMAGGLRKVIRDLINYKLIDVIVTVGSQPYQDLYAARGHEFWRSSPEVDDLALREHFLDRLYDTIVDEEKFRDTDQYLGQLFAKMPVRSYTTREILAHFGQSFNDPNSWVVAAAKAGVPIFAPALNDSSIGIGMVQGMIDAKKAGRPYPTIDPIRDAYELSQLKFRSKKTGVVYIAGGVPKNYIQQTEVISEVLGFNPGGHQYAVQITTDAPHWGALSGCTFKEAQSWGKIAKDAAFSQAYCDMTIGLPLLTTALIQKKELWQNRARLNLRWRDSELEIAPPGGASKRAEVKSKAR